MTLTLLLDLDDTLLQNPMESFLPAYMQALSGHLASFADPERLVKTLLEATQHMINNTRPECTLKDVFDAAFYPSLGLSAGLVKESIDKFYADIFPTLKNLTKTQAGAVQLVEQALERGYQVVIATNPLFPRSAIHQRLSWADLSPEDYPFALVSSYETFHFSKPNPAYLAELLARLGWPEYPAVMVGNELKNDIHTAWSLGLPAYWVNEDNSPPAEMKSPMASGDLAGVFTWLDATPPESLQPDFNSPVALLAVLRATPAALMSFSDQINDTTWAKRLQPEEWSFTEILCHLRDVEEEVNLPRILKVLQEKNPFLAGQDTDPWAEERQYLFQNGSQALYGFSANRSRLLDLLERIHPEDWDRSARHAIFGPTNLQELVSIIAGHDRLHIQQVHKNLHTSFV